MKRVMLALTAVLVLQLLMAAVGYAASPTSCPIYHRVKPGETLSYIGRLYGVGAWAIAQANYLPNPNFIYVGQVLRIPCRSWEPPKPSYWKPWYPAKAPYWKPSRYIPTGRPSYGGCTHVVRPGENLATVAWRYGTTVWALAQANRIPNPNLIYSGQRLVIPGPCYN